MITAKNFIRLCMHLGLWYTRSDNAARYLFQCCQSIEVWSVPIKGSSTRRMRKPRWTDISGQSHLGLHCYVKIACWACEQQLLLSSYAFAQDDKAITVRTWYKGLFSCRGLIFRMNLTVPVVCRYLRVDDWKCFFLQNFMKSRQ